MYLTPYIQVSMLVIIEHAYKYDESFITCNLFKRDWEKSCSGAMGPLVLVT